MRTIKVFNKTLIKLIESVFTKYLEISINKLITYIPNTLIVNDTAVDMSLIISPKIHDSFLPLQSVGKINPKGKPLPFKNTADIPMYIENGESIQIFISDFTLKSFLYTMEELGYLKLVGKFKI